MVSKRVKQEAQKNIGTNFNLTSGANMKIGQRREDGTLYLGYYKNRETGAYKDVFTTAEDAKDANGKRLTMDFRQALDYVKSLDAHSHHDWQLATSDITYKQYMAKNQGKFDGTYNSSPDSGYWSSTTYGGDYTDLAALEYFDDAAQTRARGWHVMDEYASVRPVRTESRSPHRRWFGLLG